MKIGTLINNATINDMSGSLVLVTPQGIEVQQVIQSITEYNDIHFEKLPQKLRSPRAQEIWRELYKVGYVDNKCVTTRSRTESAIMAKEMAVNLGLKHYWKEFSDLWNMTNLKSSYGKSYDTKNGWDFEKKIRNILA